MMVNLLYRILIGVMVCLPGLGIAQELIPNGSFELYRNCPRLDNILEEATPWYNPNRATPDFYHKCFPTDQMELPPRTGQGLARLFMDQGWAEYLAVPLIKQLDANEAYQFELYVSSGTPNRYPTQSFGASFSNQPITSTEKALLQANPQVMDNQPKTLTKVFEWEKVSGCFLAKGNERFVTIGNFVKLPPTLGYYYLFIDDVSLLPIKLNLGNDTTLCGRTTKHQLNAKTPGATQYLWNTGSTEPTFQVTRPGKYWVTVITPCKTLRDTIDIKYTLDFTLGPDTTICDGRLLNLNVSTTASTYRWQDGSTQRTFQVKQAGTYRVQATEPGCTASDTIQVRYIPPPQLELGPSKDLCGAETYLLKPVFAQGAFSWVDGFSSPERLITNSDVFRARVVNDCTTIFDSVVVDYGDCGCVVYAPDVFTPNGDGLNDQFVPFACGDITFTSLSIFDRWGELIFHTATPPFRWDGSYRNQPCDTNIYAWSIGYQLTQRGQTRQKQKEGALRLVR